MTNVKLGLRQETRVERGVLLVVTSSSVVSGHRDLRALVSPDASSVKGKSRAAERRDNQARVTVPS